MVSMGNKTDLKDAKQDKPAISDQIAQELGFKKIKEHTYVDESDDFCIGIHGKLSYDGGIITIQ